MRNQHKTEPEVDYTQFYEQELIKQYYMLQDALETANRHERAEIAREMRAIEAAIKGGRYAQPTQK